MGERLENVAAAIEADEKYIHIDHEALVLRSYIKALVAEVGEIKKLLCVPPGHQYVSTACAHEYHRQCRKECKFCTAKCLCTCHSEAQP